MNSSLFHRGPDEEGYFSNSQISLGVRRLAIVDLDTGQQPVHSEDSNIWAVFNGEIYNYLELREELRGKGHCFYTDHSDTEVIVHLYEEYGLDFVQKINGMFAIALWDALQQRLVLYRDRMGVKPLFYTQQGNRLLFGSEIKSILAHPDYVRQMDYEGIYHYFTFKNIPAPLTAFKGINVLKPGHMLLVWSDRQLQIKRWWSISFDEREHGDEQEIKERILDLLDDATRIRMRSDVPFGAYLSGGVDSSTIVALMSRHSDRPIKTFCLGYEDELANKQADLFHARRVATHYGTDHYEYIMSRNELIANIGKVVSSFDQPFSGTISTFFLSSLISQHVKVALSGDGADELFGSYLTHRTAQPIWHYTRLAHKIQAGRLTDAEQQLFAPCDLTFLQSLYEQSGGDEAAWRNALYLFDDKEKQVFLSDDFKCHCLVMDTASLVSGYFEGLTAHDPLNRILEMEWKTQLPDQVLSFVDSLSMSHSLEVRSPFLDYRLVEFVTGLKGERKIHAGIVKDILKKSVIGLLPQGITERAKEGFVLPVFHWMQAGLQDFCAETLSPERLAAHGLLNNTVVQALLRRYGSGEHVLAGRIWNLMMFQLWWEYYMG